jgi:two-component system, LytTR family, sensor kinase
MKRPALHLLFWFVYMVQDASMHYTWMEPLLPNFTQAQQVRIAIEVMFLVLPGKLLLAYYFILRGVKKMLEENVNWPILLLEIAVALSISVMMFTAAYYYIINPHIYIRPVSKPLINARSIMIAVLDIGYVTGLAITMKLLRLQTASKEREKALVKEKLETELKFLRTQTNPHFLFNTLNNIYALSRKKSDKTPEVVMKLSELLSFMLYESGKETITVVEEIKMMEDYIELEKIRYNERLSVRVRKNIQDGQHKIAPLLLLPLVENAFKHGASETRFDSFIYIDISLTGGYLNFNIENSVENNSKEKISNRCIGLNNIRRQLQLMYAVHEMKVENRDHTFTVNMAINLDSYGKI